MKTKIVKILTTYRVDYEGDVSLDEAMFKITEKRSGDSGIYLGAHVNYTFAATDSKLFSMRDCKKPTKET